MARQYKGILTGTDMSNMGISQEVTTGISSREALTVQASTAEHMDLLRHTMVRKSRETLTCQYKMATGRLFRGISKCRGDTTTPNTKKLSNYSVFLFDIPLESAILVLIAPSEGFFRA